MTVLGEKKTNKGEAKKETEKKIQQMKGACPLTPLRILVPNYKEGRERDKNRLCLQKLILLIH